MAVPASDFVDRADVGMVQGGSGTSFSAEPFKCLRILRQLVRQEFQGDEAAKLGVFGLVNDTIPPPPSFSMMW